MNSESFQERIDEIETELAVNLLIVEVEYQLAIERLEERIAWMERILRAL